MSGSRRPGFTMLELLMVLLLGAIVASTAYRTLTRQAETARHQQVVARAQQGERIALDLLAAELREVSVRGGDILVATPDSITIRAARKFGLVCARDELGGTVDVVRLGETFTVGDTLWIFADADTLTGGDDRWYPGVVQALVTVSCLGLKSSLMQLYNGPVRRITLAAAPAVPLSDVVAGAPVRAHQVVGYALQPEDDGSWSLARTQAGLGSVALVGPLAAPEQGGLRFTYFDDAGNAIVPADSAGRASIRRIRIAVSGRSDGAGGATRVFADTVSTQVYLKN